MIVVTFLSAAVTLLALAAFWPRHRNWLIPLLIVPWVGALVGPLVNPLYSSIAIIPAAAGVLLPLLALGVDHWRTLRARIGFWIAVAIGGALLGRFVWIGAAGQLGLNQDGQYCIEAARSLPNCPLDPVLVGNVYLFLAGIVVIAVGSLPGIILFGFLAHRRWPGTGKPDSPNAAST